MYGADGRRQIAAGEERVGGTSACAGLGKVYVVCSFGQTRGVGLLCKVRLRTEHTRRRDDDDAHSHHNAYSLVGWPPDSFTERLVRVQSATGILHESVP